MSFESHEEQARQRIRAVFDPETARQCGRAMIDLLAEYWQTVQAGNGPVQHWTPPEQLVRQAAAESEFPRAAAASAAEIQTGFEALVAAILAHGQGLYHPHYIGHQVPPPIPLAGLFDAIGGLTNQVMAIYEMGPWATACEHAMIERLGQRIGWQPGEFAGLVTSGGSLANLTGLLTARNVSLAGSWETGVGGGTGVNGGTARPVLVVQHDAHYGIARSAGILGLGTQNILRAKLDARRRMDPNRLDELLGELRSANRPIVAVAACACATPIGAFDPLPEIAAVCRRHEVWLHVDAAHGGSAKMSRRHRHLVDGLDQADSVVWDAHKMLFVPALSAFLFYRQRRHAYDAFHQDAPYLFDPSAPGMAEYDNGLKTVECTKRAATFGLWGLWSLFGPELFGDLVDLTFALARTFYEKLQAAADFHPLHEPQCNIVVFRHTPAALRDATPERLGRFQLELRRRLIESGQFYIVATSLDGASALRVTFMNPLTTADDLDELLDAIRGVGQELLGYT